MKKSMSDEWEKVHHDREWGKYPSEPVIRFVARNYYNKDRKNVKILDFGCGQGACTWYLAREGFDTYAFDGSASAIQKAKQVLEENNLKAHLDVMDGANISYSNDFFDAVIDGACIGHNRIEDIKLMYSSIYKILKKGGRMFSTFFTTKTTGFGTGEYIEKNTYKGTTRGPLAGLGMVHFWEEEELRDVIQSIGYGDIQIEKLMYTDNGNIIDMLILMAVKD
ncbi:MAG: class I SAM-dependent methyltransferase [Lachnoclostridium sp.]|nr:class I SAM-dependent methyltransferase [Lachnospira sp.]MCM1247308.1 class I SAM-dependent methyltransferase [Lachnoclostridium sp.]